MGDNRTAALPDGTDAVIEGAARTEGSAISAQQESTDSASPTGRSGTGRDDGGQNLSSSSGNPTESGSETAGQGSIAERFRSGREQLSSQAGEKARGLVSQGLERTSEALANVARLVGDTASGIEERLGTEYGDYARRAAGSIENVANSIASKDPDELIEDTRNFVRNSPGIALAGAAVVGFVVARLLKTGIAASSSSEDDGER